ncbi:MAG TPA: hypothetical protein VH370_20505 [Humisphaera sp.]|jgi:hypothetical protein|nr:hypothetical protein [Humisphaera sp.]
MSILLTPRSGNSRKSNYAMTSDEAKIEAYLSRCHEFSREKLNALGNFPSAGTLEERTAFSKSSERWLGLCQRFAAGARILRKGDGMTAPVKGLLEQEKVVDGATHPLPGWLTGRDTHSQEFDADNPLHARIGAEMEEMQRETLETIIPRLIGPWAKQRAQEVLARKFGVGTAKDSSFTAKLDKATDHELTTMRHDNTLPTDQQAAVRDEIRLRASLTKRQEQPTMTVTTTTTTPMNSAAKLAAAEWAKLPQATREKWNSDQQLFIEARERGFTNPDRAIGARLDAEAAAQEQQRQEQAAKSSGCETAIGRAMKSHGGGNYSMSYADYQRSKDRAN